MSSPKTTGITRGPILPNEEIRPTAVNGVAALSKPLLNPVFCAASPHRGRTAVRAAITHWDISRHEGRLFAILRMNLKNTILIRPKCQRKSGVITRIDGSKVTEILV